MEKYSRKSYTALIVTISAALVLLVGVMVRYYWHDEAYATTSEDDNTIVLYTQYDSEDLLVNMEELAKEYGEIQGNPKVIVENIREENFQKTLSVARDENKLPDLVAYNSSLTASLVSMGVLTDITEAVGVNKIEQFYKPAQISTLVNGKRYGIPLHGDPYIMLYNKDFVDQSEIKDIESIRALQEVQKSRVQGTYNFAFALGSNEQTVSLFYEFIYSAGGIMANVTSDNTQVVYEWFDEMKNSGLYPKEMINWTTDDLIEGFARGQVNICFVKASAISILEEYDLDFEYRVSEIPYSNRGIALYQGMNLGVSNESNMEEAVRFIEYLMDKEKTVDYIDGTHVFSAMAGYNVNCLSEEGLSDEFVEYFSLKGTRGPTNSMWFSARETIRDNLAQYFIERQVGLQELKENMEEDLKIIILEAD